MAFSCPKCQRVVYSRSSKFCGYCGELLPGNTINAGTTRRPRARFCQGRITKYTHHYHKLSLRARFAVALHCFERYCRAKNLRHPSLDLFLDQMWQLPCATSFQEWDHEADKSELVQIGFDVDRDGCLPARVTAWLKPQGVSEDEFGDLLFCTLEVIYCNALFGLANESSMGFLQEVFSIIARVGVCPPPVECFFLMLFVDDVYGKPLSPEQRDVWRYQVKGDFLEKFVAPARTGKPKSSQLQFDSHAHINLAITHRYRVLSLVARFVVALHCFDRYCRRKNLRHPMIDFFLDRMWKLPGNSFPEWEVDAHQSELFSFGLLPEEMSDLLELHGVSEEEFDRLRESTVAVITTSAYSAPDDMGSMLRLDEVIAIVARAGVIPPPVEPFAMSLFANEPYGWDKVTHKQSNLWRYEDHGNLEA